MTVWNVGRHRNWEMLLCRVVEFGCHRTSVYLHSYSASVRMESLWSVHSVLCMPLRSQKSSRSLMQSVLAAHNLFPRTPVKYRPLSIQVTHEIRKATSTRTPFFPTASVTHACAVDICMLQTKSIQILQKPSFAPMKMNGLSFQSAFFVPRSTISAGIALIPIPIPLVLAPGLSICPSFLSHRLFRFRAIDRYSEKINADSATSSRLLLFHC